MGGHAGNLGTSSAVVEFLPLCLNFFVTVNSISEIQVYQVYTEKLIKTVAAHIFFLELLPLPHFLCWFFHSKPLED